MWWPATTFFSAEMNGGHDNPANGETMKNPEADAAWNKKGATLSDKSARKELGLTQEEIIKAINRGELQYRVHSVYGNPFLRLIRGEVEALVEKKHGRSHLKQKQNQHELAQINKELKLLEKQIAQLTSRRAELVAELDQGRNQDQGKTQHRRGKKPSRRAHK